MLRTLILLESPNEAFLKFGRTPRPSGFWKSEENQRNFLKFLANQFGIQHPSEWGKISCRQFNASGGSIILKRYKSISSALSHLFPETNWQKSWFKILEHNPGYWKIKSNQRKFLEKFQQEFGIQHPSEWGNITYRQIQKKKGGASLLAVYNHSLTNTLQNVFPEINWKKEWFSKVHPSGYWINRENRRKFLGKLEKEFGIKEPSEWGNITYRKMNEMGAGSLLHKKTVFQLLRETFPEIAWKKEWFVNASTLPSGYWSIFQNQKKFVDDLGKKLSVKKPQDWGKVSHKIFTSFGGATLLKRYRGSVKETLKGIYSDISWKTDWFNTTRYPKDYFEDPGNQRVFLDNLFSVYKLKNISDWRRITLSLVTMHGGRPLLRIYNNSLFQMLQSTYPSIGWTSIASNTLQTMISRPQQIVRKFISEIFIESEIFSNFRHPGKFIPTIYIAALQSDKSSNNIELDIWIPTFNLAFEYHGQQHYTQAFRTQNDISLQRQMTRDEVRRIQCKKAGITLIEIPFWWDEKEVSLLATILQTRPDLRMYVQSDLMNDMEMVERLLHDRKLAIPKQMSYRDRGIFLFIYVVLNIPDILALHKLYNEKTDPTGWIVHELYDGKRTFFDGSTFRSEDGSEIGAPLSLLSIIPKVQLDGELWAGRLTQITVNKHILDANSPFAFIIYDAPKETKKIEDRLLYLQNLISNTSSK